MISLDQLVADIGAIGLVDPKTLAAVVHPPPPRQPPADAESAAHRLTARGLITRYQEQMLLAGKGKSLAFDDFLVVDKLGQGGMGIVLKAHQKSMDRTVAIKMISAAATKSPQAIERFKREVRATARLNHPNIVTAHQFGQCHGSYYLVIEYVEGKDLATLAKEQGKLPVDKAVDYVLQAARGLAYAHEQQIVHRDVKPGNLLLSSRGVVKILDMGLARFEKSADDQLTMTGQVMGTVDYMAPEQATSTRDVDGRADIYSLGCTLYRLLAGRPPYQGQKLTDTLLKHQMEPVPSLAAANEEVDFALEGIYQRMMAKQPDDRYGSMAEVVEALEQYQQEQKEPSSGGLGFLREVIAEADAERAARPTPKKKPPPAWLRPEVLLPAVLAVCGAAALLAWLALRPGAAGGLSQVSRSETGTVPLEVKSGDESPHSKTPDANRGSGEQAGGLSQVSRSETGTVPLEVKSGDKSPHSKTPPLAVAPFDEAKAKEYQAAWAKHLGVPVEYTNSIGMKLVLIPPGEFMMGSTEEETKREQAEAKKSGEPQWYIDRLPEEGPRHRVRITRPFYLGMYEVTQGEYEKVMGTNPSDFTARQADASAWKLSMIEIKRRADRMIQTAGKDTRRHPAERLSWDEAAEFCRRLAEMEARGPLPPTPLPPGERGQAAAPAVAGGERGVVYRLPTEAEWEYAGRAGTTTIWPSGDDVAVLRDYGWFAANSGAMTHPVGQKQPNGWQLYDMSGNVREWCSDWHATDYYATSPVDDPSGPSEASDRASRGGGWSSFATACRAAFRIRNEPGNRYDNLGFRVVGEIPNKLPSGRTVDLLPLIDPRQDTDSGAWVLGPQGLEATDISSRSQKIQPPYRPAEEYDCQVSFSPLEGNADVALGLTATGRSFVFYIKRFPSDHCLGFEAIDGKSVANGPTARRIPHLRSGHRYTVDVQVRKEGLKAWLDGELVAQWATDYRDMTTWPVWKFKDDTLLGVGCSLSKVVFHKIQVRDVTGSGTFTRPAAKAGTLLSPQPVPVHSAPVAAVAPFDAAKAKEYQAAWAKHLGVPVEYTNSIGMKLVLIPPGEFMMGSTEDEIAWATEQAKKGSLQPWFMGLLQTEAPKHRVRITKPFYLGKYEVTQSEFEQVAGTNPSGFCSRPADARTFDPPLPEPELRGRPAGIAKMAGKDTGRHPVETVTWEEAVGFCRKLTALEATANGTAGSTSTFGGRQGTSPSGRGPATYRLPTEAEWEYACRAGTTTRWYSGDQIAAADACCWHLGSAGGQTHLVGQLRPNAWNLFDMHGNVLERCQDWLGQAFYSHSPLADPVGPPTGYTRAVRGGCWALPAVASRSAHRFDGGKGRSHMAGFRVCLEVAP